VTADEYIDFLKRTDLGSQYPKERFRERIEKLVKNASISIAARAGDGQLIGVCFGITDFAYWLFLTDLGVDRRYTGQGIGKKLLQTAAGYVKKGGRLVYSTCTVSKRENQDMVKDFLAENKGFELAYEKQYFPFDDGYDGFYIGVLLCRE